MMASFKEAASCLIPLNASSSEGEGDQEIPAQPIWCCLILMKNLLFYLALFFF